MASYEIATDQGRYQVTTDDSQSSPPSFGGGLPGSGTNGSWSGMSQQDANNAVIDAQRADTPLAILSKGLNMATAPSENAALGGLPEILSQKLTGKQFVPPDAQMTPLSSLIGMGAGIPSAAGVGAASLVKGSGLLANIAKGALGGGASMAAILPSPSDAPTMQDAGTQLLNNAKTGAEFGGALGAGISVLSKGSTILQHLLGKDIQEKYVPEMEKIYNSRVDDFTPHIQELAIKTLGVPEDIVQHIADRSPKIVTSAANAVNNDPALIQSTLDKGLAQKDAEVTDAYKNSIGQAPPKSFIQIPKATQAAEDYLTNKGIIDPQGNLTGSGATRINSPIANDNSSAVDRAIYAKWQQMKEFNSQVTPSQWLDMRSGLSGIRKMADYEAPATNLLDAMHQDVNDAGFDVQNSRQLAAQHFEAEKIAKPFISDSGENKFTSIFNLPTKQLNKLQEVGDYIGQPLVEQAKNVQANNILINKIRRYGTSYIGSPSSINNKVENVASISPQQWAAVGKARQALHEILGNGQDVNSVLNGLQNRKLIIGAGIGYAGYRLEKRLGGD